MKNSEIEAAVFTIIQSYGKVLEKTAKRPYGTAESMLPYSKKVIKNAIKVALSLEEKEDIRRQLKSGYIALANFIPDQEAENAEEVSREIFSFLEMEEDRKKDFLQARFKSGLLGDYEIAVKITSKIAVEQKRLQEEIEVFLENMERDPSRSVSED